MPKALSDQVVVITGASSGIGRQTAIELGRRGAAVVLAARNEEALERTAAEIDAGGTRVESVPTDVADWDQVERLADRAVERFGRIDTWANVAAVTTYASVEEMTVEEIERIVRVNLLGQIHGMKAALPHLKRAGDSVLINVSSALGKRSVPLQSAYCATKAGILGFADSLRMELVREGSGVSVTSILPGSINTPYFNNARSKMGVKPMPPPPIYEPSVVAESIAFAAEHPRREIVVGGGGKQLTLMGLAPALADRLMVARDALWRLQQTSDPDDGRDNLFSPSTGPGASRGDFGDQALGRSLYTRALEHHPNVRRAMAGMLGARLLRR